MTLVLKNNPIRPPTTVAALTDLSSALASADGTCIRKPPIAMEAATNPAPEAKSPMIDPTGSTRRA